MVSSISSASSISQLFAKLDTKNQGYIEKSDLVSAFSQIGTSSSDSTAEDVFAAFDSNSDGQVTESEFSSTLSKLQQELESQFGSMRMGGFSGTQGAGGMAGTPPPPPQDDTGFTKAELQSQLDEIGSTDSKRSSLISNVVNNFDAADTNSDGKVSFSEAQAYDQSSTTSSASTDNATASASATASNDEAQLMLKIMQLMHAYGGLERDQNDSVLNSTLSVTA